MKRPALYIVSIASAVLLLTGCGPLTRLLTKPVVTQQPAVTPASTNVVTLTNRPEPVIVYISSTNTLHEVETRYVTNTPPPEVITQTLIRPAVTNYVEVTNWVANPDVLSGVETAKGLNASLNPTPTEPAVNWGLGLVTLLASGLAAYQNRQANKKGTALDTVTDVARSLAIAVETLPSGVGDTVKDTVARISAVRGNAGDVHALVQDAVAGVNPTVTAPAPAAAVAAV